VAEPLASPNEAATPGPVAWEGAAQWGGASEMTDFDALMWRTDRHPQLSNCVTLIEMLDVVPDWTRFVEAHEWATSLIPRLRQRVLDPPVPVTAPVWITDPHFDISYHVRRVGLPAPATEAELIGLTESLALAPFDTGRPLWEVTLVEGLEGGRGAVILKIHHAMTDGMGFMQLLTVLHSRTRDPSPDKPTPEPPAGEVPDRIGRMATQLARDMRRIPRAAAGGVARNLKRAAHPTATSEDALQMAESLRRSATPPAPPSPLFRDRTSKAWRFGVLECELADLKASAKSCGGTVNDAFLAALLGGLARYHDRHGEPVTELPVMFPVSRRREDDPAGGNRMVAAFFAGPAGLRDPAARIGAIHEAIKLAKGEPALSALEVAAPILSRLPSEIGAQTLFRLCGRADLSASNVPGLRHEVFVAGARVERLWAFGPLLGAATLVTMNSHAGTCCIGVNCDGSVIEDRDVMMDCLGEGLDEVLALAPVASSPPS
jgi:diacylglycerol O-acyltransferase / wax synthase